MHCDVCKKEVVRSKVHAFYPGDATHICRKCFGKPLCISGANRVNGNRPHKTRK